MRRKCAECPPWTKTVCRHAFGKFWNDKSTNGEGCEHPLDDVAEAWSKAGWTPEKGTTRRIVLPLPGPLPKMPRRPRRMVQGDLILCATQQQKTKGKNHG